MFQKKDSHSKIFIQFLNFALESKLEDFRLYTREIDFKYKQEVNSINERYDRDSAGLSDYEKAELKELISEDYFNLEDIYIKIHRRSVLVSIYSFIESSLNKLCFQLNARYKYPVKLEDIKGDGVIRSKTYLEKLAKIDFNLINSEWSKVQELNKIRNCIVHCEGDITGFKQKTAIENIVKSNKHLSLSFDREIMLDHDYIEITISNAEEFLKKVYNQAFKQ